MNVGRPPRAVALALWWTSVWPSSTRADQPDAQHPLVQVDIDACTGASPEEARRLLRIELGALLVDDAPSGEIVTRATVSCAAHMVRLRVDDPITGKSLTREVELDESDVASRSRLIALAVAELVDASWTELESNPRPEVPPAGARPPPAAVEAARKVVQHRRPRQVDEDLGVTRMVVVVSRRAFFSESTAQWGGGMRLGRDQFTHVGWTADVLAEHGETEVSLGKVALDTLTLGGSLYLFRRWSRVTFQLGAGLGLGAARLSGTPYASQYARAGSGVAPWGWPTAIAAIRLRPIGPLVVEASGELGYVVLPMNGNVAGRAEVTISGPWVGAQLGLGTTM